MGNCKELREISGIAGNCKKSLGIAGNSGGSHGTVRNRRESQGTQKAGPEQYALGWAFPRLCIDNSLCDK